MNRSFIPYIVGAIMVLAVGVGTTVFIHAAVYAPEAMSNTVPSVSAASLALTAAAANSSTASPTAIGSSTVPTRAVAQPANYPARLLIPSLSINAAVQDVGITAKNNIGIPSNFTDVAWYKYSVVPGQPGSAIIDGHVDNGLGLAGVFKHLSSVATGTEIEVVTNAGTILHFSVTDVTAYDYQTIPIASLLTNTGAPILRLITCEGDWVPDQKTYNERLVITAALAK